jgi:ABC-type amino acid transport substrate-binding protein
MPRPDSQIKKLLTPALLVLLSLVLPGAAPAHAETPAVPPTRVIAASDSWDQLLYLDEHQVPRGPIAEFINRMNAVQDKFRFELLVYPRLRVDAAFIAKEADVYPLRTMLWAGPALGLQPTRTILVSGDVYFARRKNRFGGRAVFNHLQQKNLVGVRGYHYRVFDNNADEAFIKKNFKADLLGSNEAVVKFVMAGHADVGILPEAILAKYLEAPAMREQLIIGDDYDSRVELSNLVRKDGPISVDDMNQIIDLLGKSGDIRKLKARLSIAAAHPLKSPARAR